VVSMLPLRCPTTCALYAPQVALLPGHSVEEGGDDEERAKSRPVEPGRHALPLVVGAEVQHGAAQQTGDYPQLPGKKAMKKKKKKETETHKQTKHKRMNI